MIFECGGPRIYSYEELLRTIAREAGLKPILIPYLTLGTYWPGSQKCCQTRLSLGIKWR
jgi:hypothetical protein